MNENQTITFLKFFIPASVMMPMEGVIKDKISFLWSLNKEEAYEVALDSAMSGAIEKPDSALGNSQIIQCEFSPLIYNERYLIG